MSQNHPSKGRTPDDGLPNKDDFLDDAFFESLLDSDTLSSEELLESAHHAHRRAQVSVPTLLEQLISAPEDPDIHTLTGLSNLSRADAAEVRQMWPSIPVERRQRIVTELVEFAEHDFSLHLASFLQLMLEDDDPVVRVAAINGLWEDVSPELIGDLLHVLHHDPATEVRAVAAHVLGAYILAGELEELDSLYAMRVEQALLSVIHNLTEPAEIRAKALESLSFSSEIGVRQLIEDAYYSADKVIRVSSLISMGRSADVRWRGLLRAELQNPARAMRMQAAIACGELESQDAVSDLMLLLEDSVQDVRLAAIFALGRIGGKDATKAIGVIATHEDSPPEEAEAAKLALEEMAFYANADGISLFDESLALEEEWDIEPWDVWDDNIELGFYEDDEEEF